MQLLTISAPDAAGSWRRDGAMQPLRTSKMATPNQAKALIALCEIILETVQESPDGAPSGVIYAALMSIGISLAQYEALVDVLVKSGRITRSGHVLRAA